MRLEIVFELQLLVVHRTPLQSRGSNPSYQRHCKPAPQETSPLTKDTGMPGSYPVQGVASPPPVSVATLWLCEGLWRSMQQCNSFLVGRARPVVQ